jgi:glycosyltransferase involved in cell wall biosynthesis
MRDESRPLRVGFVLEQALGHVTYGRNIISALEGRGDIDPVWIEVPFAPRGLTGNLPGVRSNWSIRGSIEARRGWNRAGKLDALFLHTQTISLLAASIMERVPTVLSLDATPVNFDEVGAAYGHRPGSSIVESFKRRAHRRVVSRAAAFTTWSEWAKRSLVEDYGADASRVEVRHPGANLSLFEFGRQAREAANDRPLRLLFVGGDLARKGGDLLLDLMRGPLQGRCELDLVTGADAPALPGVFVHRNVGPNSSQLLELYRRADVFVLPTQAECLAVVLGEAMAAGLPIITTPVGAHAEAVVPGETGFLVPPRDRDALLAHIEMLLATPQLAVTMGQHGRKRGEERFDAHKNAHAIGDLIVSAADGFARRGQQSREEAA